MQFDLLPLTLDELWAIHDYVRQHDKLGQEWDKDFVARIMSAILEAQENSAHQATLFVYDEDELWQIDRQVPSALMTGVQPVGRNLLIKVMQLIVKIRGGENAEYTGSGSDAREDPAGGASSEVAS